VVNSLEGERTTSLFFGHLNSSENISSWAVCAPRLLGDLVEYLGQALVRYLDWPQRRYSPRFICCYRLTGVSFLSAPKTLLIEDLCDSKLDETLRGDRNLGVLSLALGTLGGSSLSSLVK